MEAVCVCATVRRVFVAGSIIEVQTQEGQGDTECLDGGRGTPEPDNGNDDDEDTLDEGGDRIGNG